jgi:hypothetical protein
LIAHSRLRLAAAMASPALAPVTSVASPPATVAAARCPTASASPDPAIIAGVLLLLLMLRMHVATSTSASGPASPSGGLRRLSLLL